MGGGRNPRPLFLMKLSQILTSSRGQEITRTAYFLFICVTIFVVIYQIPKSYIVPATFFTEQWKHEFINAIHYLSIVITIVFLARKMLHLRWKEMGFHFTEQNNHWAYWVCFGLVINVFVELACLARCYFYFLFHPNYQPPAVLAYPTIFLSEHFNSYVFSPFFEELLFRGIGVTCLEKIFGQKWALLFSAWLFFNAHFLYGNQNICQFLLGLMLGYSFLKTRSLFWPIILHSLSNFMGDGYSIIEWIFPGSMNRFFMW